MIRQYVNLIASSKSRLGAYSLHRLDGAKHLFYPSTAEAQAVNADSNGSGDDEAKPKSTRMGAQLRRLPTPTMQFKPLPLPNDEDDFCTNTEDDMFALLSSRTSEGRILSIRADGDAVLYDADSNTISTMPSLGEERPSIKLTVVAVDCGGAGTGDDEKKVNRLYMLGNYTSTYGFYVLDFNQHPRKWQPLPLPPFFDLEDDSLCAFVNSYTVVGGGRAICMSFDGDGTYCFNTVKHEWSQAGDWELPFTNRAEYVPELGAWLGFSPRRPNYLCASMDLSAAIDTHQAPMLRHVWKDFHLPPNEDESIVLNRRYPSFVLRKKKTWGSLRRDLVNLGAGRFCLARIFHVSASVGWDERLGPDEDFAVLTGVEVLRGNDEEEGLRMVKHKSRRYMFSTDIIDWVL